MSFSETAIGRLLWREGVRLAGVLIVAAALAFLFRDSGAQAIAEHNPAARRPMPTLTGKDLNGSSWRVADQRGSIVLVNFWASWCPPCRAEMPGLVRFSNAYANKGVKVVGVSMDDDIETARRFVTQLHVEYPILDGNTSTSPTSGMEALPTSFLLDRKGLIAKTYMGAVTEPELARDVESLLDEK